MLEAAASGGCAIRQDRSEAQAIIYSAIFYTYNRIIQKSVAPTLTPAEAEDAESALAKGWAAYKEPRWPLKLVDEQADDNGWSRRERFEYQTSPNERRGVVAGAMFANDRWTVWIYDMADEVGGKRSAAVGLLFASLLPKGYERESFAAL